VYEKRIEIRWRDLDAYAHVNQAVYLTYIEETLDDWLRHVFGLAEGDVWDYVAAHTSIDYRSELRLADRHATGRASLVRVGRKSVTVRVELAKPDGTIAAEAELVIVARRPITDEERQALELS
jgi:acyl-CoA thioester hydrolase